MVAVDDDAEEVEPATDSWLLALSGRRASGDVAMLVTDAFSRRLSRLPRHDPSTLILLPPSLLPLLIFTKII